MNLSPPDSILATVTVMLMAIGIISVYSAGVMEGTVHFESTTHFVIRQMIAAVIGLAGMVLASRLPLSTIEKFATVFGVVTLIVLALVLIPGIGTVVGGARRWIRLGPINFQPSEFARLATVLLVAKYAATHAEELKTLRGFGKAMLLPAVFAGLINLEPDFDTALMVLLIGGIILFCAGIPLGYVLIIGTAGVIGAWMLVIGSEYRYQRILGFLDPWSDARGKGYHIIQSWTAMGSGGFFGKGLGNSVQKLGFLPEAHTDFIFAIIGEEGGFIVASAIVALFGVLAWRGYRIAAAQTIPFARYLAIGITAMITLQALLNMMVVTGLAPTTGVPLPLVSYGGTSWIFMATSIGLLWGLSRNLPQK